MVHGQSLSEETRQQLTVALDKIPHSLWFGQEEDPYLGFLSHSDAIIVSNSSSLMVAEATSAGKPLFIYPVVSLSSYVETLLQKGYAFLLGRESSLFPRFMLPPLQEKQRVAEILKESYSE